MNAYAPHERLVLHARRTPELWRLVLGLFLAMVVMFALTRAFFALAQMVLPGDTYLALAASLSTGEDTTGLLLMLLLMGAMGIGAIVAAELLHQRKASSLFGPWHAFSWQFARVFVAIVALYAVVSLLPPWGLPEGTTPGLEFGAWLRVLPLTLGALLVQTGSEELLFRGYMQSQLAARFQQPAVWMVLPSALFAILHYAPDAYGENAIVYVVWAFFYGLAAADLTARSGTLAPAIAFHFLNNFAALALVSFDQDMSGLALYRLPFGPEDVEALRPLFLVDLVMVGVTWLTARLALRR